ncbi:hypothetical protein RclHR1_23830004 [Rhizophagus clarus]|uniref:Uncharacterized protein n=1 Tax=Rhizophagus clarus TaxID=94130 RepID=A0A2Z6QW77_9GLOM|nr:hypothetical protein RclHR1_23830004 [Rhizophagus clarus]
MSNVYTLNDIKDKEGGSYKKPGHRLDSAYEQELEKKIRSVTEFNSEINDLSEKLVDTKSHSESQHEFEAKYTAEIKSLKSNIKTLKRGATLAQKASSADKIKIFSLETKVRELEGKLDDLELEQMLHDSNAVGGMIEEPAQSDPKEIDSLRLELERVKKDLNSKEYTIKCMKKEIEATYEITSREIDALYSARSKLMEKNRSLRDQLELEKNNKVDPQPLPMNDSLQLGPEGIPSTLNPSQIISVGGAEAVSLLATAPIVTSSSIPPMLIYSILTLVLIMIICFMARKWWNLWKKDDRPGKIFLGQAISKIIPN